MRKNALLLIFLFSAGLCFAQGIGIGTTAPDINAILDIRDNSRGILIPRMDSTRRQSIPATKGLLVYDSSYHSFWYNNGENWVQLISGGSNSGAVPKAQTIGDMLYWNGVQWSLIPVGIPGQALVLNSSGLPRWGAATADTGTNGNAYFFPSSNNSAYKSFLGLLYARFASIEVPGGNRFIPNNEPDYDFMRSLWMLQETPTDEAILAWNDAGVQELNQGNFNPGNPFFKCMYVRLKDVIVNVNSFLSVTTPERLAELALPAQELQRINTYRAEARFLKALAYYYAIDLFGGFELLTPADPAPAVPAPYINRLALFNLVETELLALEADLPPARTNEYGRADKACAWMLLAKLYLNAGVYTGNSRYTDCLTNLNKIINTAAFSLTNQYRNLFLADNHNNGAESEIIFPIIAHGKRLPTFGNTTFLTHAAVGGSMVASDYGIDAGWAGIRTRREAAAIMDQTGTSDSRNLLYKNGQNQNITTPQQFTDGYGITKYSNKLSNGGNSDTTYFVSTDFPLFRLADVWLMYAECVLRGGNGGNMNMAVTFMNFLRGRSGAASVSQSDLTLEYIFNERTRELYWEGHRRTDLVRFNRFTGNNYIWQWKGGTLNGTGTAAFTNLFPLPLFLFSTNENVVQNPGY